MTVKILLDLSFVIATKVTQQNFSFFLFRFSGYQIDINGQCTDIDECAEGTSSCNPKIELCENHQGGYLCKCKTGYETGPPGGKTVSRSITSCSATTSNNLKILKNYEFGGWNLRGIRYKKGSNYT